MKKTDKYRIGAVLVLALGLILAYFVYSTEVNKDSDYGFSLGLDLSGGTHLVYQADVSDVPAEDVDDSMASLRDVIERRVNLFGVSEPLVQTQRPGLLGDEDYHRLIVELPGVTDVEEATEMIGETPLLEFKLMTADDQNIQLDEEGNPVGEVEPSFVDTGLTGRFLNEAQLNFDQLTGEPTVSLTFNQEGSELFAQITEENIEEVLAIFLDGQIMSMPVIREQISDGRAEISGNFSPEEARELVRDLNFGALPVPIELLSTQTIGPSLGERILDDGINAGIVGFILLSAFLIFWYRLPGLLAVVALSIYVLIMLSLFKTIPVVLTAAGIAGFILSIGMAVDANILIFERMKEEVRAGKSLGSAIDDGFSRAWLSIRDGNLSSIITAVILFWFGTSMVEGFALVFGLGVLISMLSAITISRTLLKAFGQSDHKNSRFLFSSGFSKGDNVVVDNDADLQDKDVNQK